MASTETRPLPSNSLARYGCYLGLLLGLFMTGYGLYMLGTGALNPIPFQLAMLLGGLIQGVTCVYGLLGNRPAWSFALSLNGTLFLVFLFGAPKVRDGWELPMGVGLLPCILFGLAAVLLAMGSDDY